MATENQDAVASAETAYMMSAGDTFEGTIDNEGGDTEDWISIELDAGTTYTISVSGTLAAGEGEMDTILKLLDSKGGEIDMNDDTEDGLGSALEFTPDVSATYYISVSTYQNNPNLDNSGTYTVSVTGVLIDPAVGKELTGTKRVEADTTAKPPVEYASGNDKLTGTDANDTIMGLSGDDTLTGLGGDDTLDGGADNDLLEGGPGADTLKGGAGIGDTISYVSSMEGVTINLGDGTARGGHADGDTIGDDIENVRGTMYDDMLTGSSAANSLWGLGGNDELDGGRRIDHLYGGDGDDMLDGGDGDDTLEGGHGADMLTGGDDKDTASYSMSAMGVTVRLHSGQAMGGDAEGDSWNLSVTETYTDNDEEEVEVTLADIENLTGSPNDDILAGDLRDNTIMGGGGDDKIYGGPNPADVDKETGGGLTNVDMLYGDGGDDMIYGGAGGDTLWGGAGNDTLHGGPGADTVYGGAGSDMIYADDDDTIDGGETMGAESGEEEGDVDTVSYERLEDGVTKSLASDMTGIENIIGSQGDDNLTGSDGGNVIEGGEGADILNGGMGVDTLSYESSDDWVRVTLNDSGEATASRGHASGDTATNFENLTGSAHDDDLTGNMDGNVIKGLAGDDDIEGGAGDDTVEGGAGADEVDGGAGTDTLSYASSDARVTVNLATAAASGGHASGDTIDTQEEDHDMDEDTDNIDVATFENVTGSMHNDNLTGDHRANSLSGGAGNDTLRGGAGADMLTGGPGADMLDGGSSASGDNGTADDPSDDPQHIDWAVYKGAEEGIMVDLSTGMGTGGEAMDDTLVNIELVWGSEHDDTFIASNSADIIEGDGGSDTVSYAASELGVTVDLSDTDQNRMVVANTDKTTGETTFPNSPFTETTHETMEGVQPIFADDDMDESEDNPNTNGARGDKLGSIENLTGSAHDDKLTGDRNPNELMGGAGDDVLDGGGNADTLDGGAGNDMLNGGGGIDELMGGAGHDVLDGGGGDDTINGGAGDDDLTGGDGNDTFVFRPMDGAGSDIIMDWKDGDNEIDLSAYALSEEQVIAAITIRGDQAVINLEAHGGGRITLEGVGDLDDLDQTGADGVDDDNNTIDVLSDAFIV